MAHAHRLWTLSLIGAFASTGCAVDPSGLGPARSGIDMTAGERDSGVDPPDARPPDAQSPRDMFRPDLNVDSSVPPPDMCVAEAESCNGVDDDCNGAIDDGLLSGPCDGDGDGCNDGASGCSGGSTTCADELPMAGDGCDGPDADLEPEGSLACDSNSLVCVGDCTPSGEVCDRRDNDCDGEADEGEVCSNPGTTCIGRTFRDSVYLFCSEGDGGDGWQGAREECRENGYELVQIDDEAERRFLTMHTGGDDYWTDARADTGNDDVWSDPNRWDWDASGDPVDPGLWDAGEPSGNSRCARLRNGSDRLDDADCGENRFILCEGPLVP